MCVLNGYGFSHNNANSFYSLEISSVIDTAKPQSPRLNAYTLHASHVYCLYRKCNSNVLPRHDFPLWYHQQRVEISETNWARESSFRALGQILMFTIWLQQTRKFCGVAVRWCTALWWHLLYTIRISSSKMITNKGLIPSPPINHTLTFVGPSFLQRYGFYFRICNLHEKNKCYMRVNFAISCIQNQGQLTFCCCA